ncbi:SET domain-containing protein [Xylariaceae sp. FL1651]|nr:SET domain-containing protein [Xylariaceae sp. FL1651]
MPTLPEGIALKRTTSSPRGRGITASRTLRPGEIIATFSSPSIAIPDSPHLSTTCSGCLLPGTSAPASELASTSQPSRAVRACTGCRTVAYCSPACQKLDWTAGGHKAECKVFKRVRAEGHDFLPTPVRALVQVLLRPEMSAAMAEMEGHVDKFRRESGKLWADMELQAMAALHYLGRDTNAKSLSEAIEVLCKLQVNSFNRLDDDVGQTGLFMNPALAMVNHSCIPNAFVQFVGRQAVLHAYEEIKKDEEVEISYIDCTLHRSHRQEALKTRYHFTCSCLRCKDYMDVYQVCRVYPHLSLNSFSLVPDIQKLRDPPFQRSLEADKPLSATVEEIYPWCSPSLQELGTADKAKQLRQRWRACKLLRASRAHAVEPLPRVLTEASMYFGEQGNYPHSLSVASFLALHVDPYKAAAPFAPQRVKGLLMIAKLLANTAPPADHPCTDTGEGAVVRADELLQGKLARALGKMDQPTVCQVLLELVVYYAPAAHSREWAVYHEAKDLLGDLEALQGRETEYALVKAFMRNPNGAEERRFFEQIVLDPLRELSTFCLEIMDSEFDS